MTDITIPEPTVAAAEGESARWKAQIRALACCVRAGVPAVLWGAPGAAKTAIVEQLFKSICAASHVSIAALHEPPEYGGYPSPVAAGKGAGAFPAHVAQLAVGWVLRLARAAEANPGRRVGLFLDELSNAPPATRSAAMRGVLDGTWGEVTIQRLSVVAASNPEELSESGYRFSAALANRFCHLEWKLPAGVWAEAYVDGFSGGLPAGCVPEVSDPLVARTEAEQVRPVVAGLARFRPDLFSGEAPEDQDKQSGAWASPRTWTLLSRVLAVALASGEDPQSTTCRILIRGLVGDVALTQLLDYWRALDLPDPESLLRDPDSVRWPARGDQCYAILASVGAAARRDLTPARWQAAWKVFGSAARAGRAAYAASAVRALAVAGRHEKWDSATKLVPELHLFCDLLDASGGFR